jgi:hypothetical protein
MRDGSGDHMHLKSRLIMPVAIVAIACGLAVAQTSGQPERFVANAVSLSPEYGTGQRVVEINVDRWSPPSDRERLIAALMKSPDELLKQLQRTRAVGTIRTPDSLGYDLHYAQQTPLPEGGRSIVIATDRPIGFWEATNRPRSIDYPFTVIQMNLDRNGMGSGTLSYATRITTRNNIIELENFASQPIMLNNIKAQPKNATK